MCTRIQGPIRDIDGDEWVWFEHASESELYHRDPTASVPEWVELPEVAYDNWIISGDLTDYQVRFTVWNTTGTDNGENVYLGTNVKPDYSDLRFTTIDNAKYSVLDPGDQ